jgi:hypothetical protein
MKTVQNSSIERLCISRLRSQGHISHGLIWYAHIDFDIEAASSSHRIYTLMLKPRNSLCWIWYNVDYEIPLLRLNRTV